MKKIKRYLFAAVAAMMLFLTGCGTELYELTAEEEQLIIHSAAYFVAKHNIRTQNKYVPVIDLKRIMELFKSKSLNSVFHMIRNHEYEIRLPKEAQITHNEINYGGYVFKTPAICFGSPIDIQFENVL